MHLPEKKIERGNIFFGAHGQRLPLEGNFRGLIDNEHSLIGLKF